MVDFAKLRENHGRVREAVALAKFSPDPSTKVGAVVVLVDGTVSRGYNAFPSDHPQDPELYADREYKYKHILHAERAALYKLPPGAANGATLYTSFPCCLACVTLAAEQGVTRIVSRHPDYCDPARVEAWRASFEEAGAYAAEKGIVMEFCRV